jgi:hypothetical protein
MKTILIIIASVTINYFSYGQQAMTFGEAKEKGIRTSYLDSIYQNGIHSDTSFAVFKTNVDEYMNAYQKLLQELGNYLKANDFLWTSPTKGFNRIYFAKDGKIDYFLYSFRPDQLSLIKEDRFGELLSKFILDYKFPMEAKVKFAQCSPVTYMPAAK